MNNRNIKIPLSTERRMVNSHRCAAWLILIGSVQSLCPSPLDQGRYLVVVAFFEFKLLVQFHLGILPTLPL
jgi:hypothetical protein